MSPVSHAALQRWNPTSGTEALSASGVIQLQRSAGNRAVTDVLQRAQAPQAPAQSPSPGTAGSVIPEVAEGIASSRSSGSRISDTIVQRAGAALGTDLSGVRVHADSESDLLSRSLGAKAFTTGSDIFFSKGAYDPSSSSGRHLLAHELTHVSQQRGAGSAVQTKLEVGSAGSPSERAADDVADLLAPQLDVSVHPTPGGVPAAIGQRSEASVGAGSRHVARQLDQIHASSPRGLIQRSIGLEFQTMWGIVRSLPNTPSPLNTRADDPDPEKQTDWEDEKIDHVATPGPAKRNWFKKLLDKISGKAAPTAQPNNDGSVWLSNSRYRDARARGGGDVNRPGAGREHFRLFKPQVVKDFGGYKLTVDDAGTALGAEVEWVIDPPIPESADPSVLEDVMDRLKNTVEQLVNHGGNKDAFMLSEVTNDVADSTIELQPGIKGTDGRSMKAQAQVTGGVGMDQILTMFKDMGKVDSERNKESTVSNAVTEMSAGGEGAARNAAKVGMKVAGSERLKGLVAYIFRYLSMASQVTGGNVTMPYAKVSTLFLARTDFKQMFALLPEDERKKYGGATYGGGAEHVEDFVRLVQQAIADAGLHADYGDGAKKVFDRPIKGGVTIDVTRGDWLRAIANGTGDLLSGKYQASLGNAGNAEQLESMGNLESKRDRVGVDPDEVKQFTGIVTEFRGHTGLRAPNTWPAYAMRCFKYLKELNQRPR